MMSYFAYFKFFNEANKLNENDYINYDDSLLIFIYKNRDIDLAEIIFPLVENKSLINKLIDIIDICSSDEITLRWINVIFNNGFNQKSEIDISSYDNLLLLYACKYKLINIIECFIRLKNMNYALFHPTINGDLHLVKYLVENGADIHDRNDYALRFACENGHIDIVKYLVEKGADVHVFSESPIRYSIVNGHLEVVKFLVSIGANPHADFNYLIRVAKRKRYNKLIEYLESLPI